jgi:hypothetical protein
MDLATITCDQFAACLNQDFEIVLPDAILLLKLTKARQLGSRPESIREPFSLTFLGPPNVRVSQGTYKIRNAALGEMEIFLVPIGADQASRVFEAVFN